MRKFIQNTIQSQKVFYRYFRRKGWRRFLKENILETDGSNRTKALSIALGIFIGLSPFWGFHTILVLFFASIFRLNKLLSYMFTHVSFPLFIPFIIAASMFIGAPFVHGKSHFDKSQLTLEFAKENLLQYFIGSMILATCASIIIGLFFYFILKKISPDKN